ncbi:MAG: hypothetical protein M1825_002956 [Sarcosagium campestre]|nr:MAG: hypothetical protein M1825_002956 [Sarcosagium campestre]
MNRPTRHAHPIDPPRPTRSKAFLTKLSHMRHPLAALVSITTGQAHPAFPRTVLEFWLLTGLQLDDMAIFYHQHTSNNTTTGRTFKVDNDDHHILRNKYPKPIRWSTKAKLETKRRRFGRFIGIQGCESPIKSGSVWALGDRVRKQRWVRNLRRDVASCQQEEEEEEEEGISDAATAGTVSTVWESHSETVSTGTNPGEITSEGWNTPTDDVAADDDNYDDNDGMDDDDDDEDDGHSPGVKVEQDAFIQRLQMWEREIDERWADKRKWP